MRTARIETPDDFFQYYEQKLSAIQSLRYIDPRDHILRKRHYGIFMNE